MDSPFPPPTIAESTALPVDTGGSAETVAGASLTQELAAERDRLAAEVRERERVEAAMRASEERYRRLVEFSPEAIAVHRQGTLLYVNPAGAALVGAAGPEDLLGRSIFDFVHPDYRAVVAQRVRQVQAESSPAAVIQERFLRLDGHPVDVEVVAIPIAYDGDAASLVVIRDVTARTEAEAAVAESRDQLDVILRGVADGITAQAPDGRLVYANDAAARLLGFASAQALLSTPVAEVMGGFVVLDERGNVVPLDSLPQRRALAGERPEPAWVRFRVVATGEEHWSLLSSAPVFDDTGHVRLAISIFRDLTERKRAEERLRFLADAGAQLPSSLDVVGTLRSVAQMAVHTLADWSVAYLATFAPTIDEQAGAPGAATAALGVELVAVAHRDANKLALAEELQQRYPPGPDEPAMLWQVMRTGEPVFLPAVSEELLARAAHDPAHLVLLQALQIRSAIWVPLVARGRTLGAIGLFGAESGRQYTADDVALAEEIARRAALAVDNARLYREAQEAIRARDEFLSIAAHELRTPVTALKGTADLLARMHARGTLDEARLEQFLGLLRDSGNRLATLIEDLLDVSRLQTGQLALRLRPIDVGPFVVEVVERYRHQIAARHTPALDVPAPGALAAVAADPARLEQVLANLLTNAVKYAPKGGPIRVAVSPHEGGVLIAVTDQGIGLPPGSEERIFEPFGRATNATAQHIQGMGLGLHIARRIVERHGGRIWAESAGEGKGTTVKVWLPSMTGDE